MGIHADKEEDKQADKEEESQSKNVEEIQANSFKSPSADQSDNDDDKNEEEIPEEIQEELDLSEKETETDEIPLVEDCSENSNAEDTSVPDTNLGEQQSNDVTPEPYENM